MHFAFDDYYAEKHGIDCAIMIQNMQFWIFKNRANGKHFHDGHYWTYNSMKAMTEMFRFWSKHQIERILRDLVDKDVLIKGNYNTLQNDRTCWYAFKDESEFLPKQTEQNGEIHFPKSGNPFPQTGTPLPDTNTDTDDSFINKTIISVGDKKIEDNGKVEEAKRVAKLLSVEIQKITKRKLNTSGWYRPILMMMRYDHITIDRMLDVMTWHFNNLDRKYCHTVLSAQSFREKFAKIEEMMRRKDGWY